MFTREQEEQRARQRGGGRRRTRHKTTLDATLKRFFDLSYAD